eukprot:TRINITY_DN28607_c0_g2_i1.p1 TRINITY_DN28607_c0_g2~~TRINITY_DN28607_c0_g2_i1.p1  ORF type:complete len:701 (-),score=142.43 TRINITY_DN28607_c0_g2_i1:146-2191(-)
METSFERRPSIRAAHLHMTLGLPRTCALWHPDGGLAGSHHGALFLQAHHDAVASTARLDNPAASMVELGKALAGAAGGLPTAATDAIQADVPRTLTVRVASAVGIRPDADGIAADAPLPCLGPRCAVWLSGKPASRLQTDAAKSCAEPVWAHTGEVSGFVPGDVLQFSVFQEGQPPECGVGVAELPSSAFYPDGFKGEVVLHRAGCSDSKEKPLEAAAVAATNGDALLERFAAAQLALKVPSDAGTLSNTDKLKLYANYKQATTGDAHGKRPGAFDQKGRYKYDAWATLKGVDADAAMREYILNVDRLVPGWDKDLTPHGNSKNGLSPSAPAAELLNGGAAVLRVEVAIAKSLVEEVGVVHEQKGVSVPIATKESGAKVHENGTSKMHKVMGFWVHERQLPKGWQSQKFEALVHHVCNACGGEGGGAPNEEQALRLLLGFNFSAEAAVAKWREVRAWRKLYEMDKERQRMEDDLRQDEDAKVTFPHEEEVYSGFIRASPCALIAADGSPVSVWHVGSMQAELVSLTEVASWGRHVYEYADLWVQEESRRTGQLLGHIQVFDLHGLTWRQTTSRALIDRFKLALDAGSQYVEVASHIYVINSSSLFSMAWKVVRKLISPWTASKVTVSTGVPTELLEELGVNGSMGYVEDVRAACSLGLLPGGLKEGATPAHLPPRRPPSFA